MRLAVGVGVRRDMERLIDAVVEEEEEGVWVVEVLRRITWHSGVLGPTVVARCTDILLAMVPWVCEHDLNAVD